MQVVDLFSGIGGFSLAARWIGWDTVQMVEIDEFCQKVLKYHFPEAAIHNNIKTFDIETLKKSRWNSSADTIVCGGFPCQPYSLAGKRKGKEDDRHLWPEMLRAIREIQPRWVVGENVFGLINWSGGLVFHEVQTDLEAAGYEVQPYVLPACSINAPHRRDRVWFVAHSNGSGNNKMSESKTSSNEGEQSTNNKQSRNRWSSKTKRHGKGGVIADANNARFQKTRPKQQTAGIEQHGKLDGNVAHASYTGLEGRTVNGSTGTGGQEREQQFAGHICTDWENFPTQSPICSGDDGLSGRLDGITFSKWRNESIKAYGNSVVPQLVFQIFKAIELYDNNP